LVEQLAMDDFVWFKELELVVVKKELDFLWGDDNYLIYDNGVFHKAFSIYQDHHF